MKKWNGSWPAKCDICGIQLTEQPHESAKYETKVFVDGRMEGCSSWALMCIQCFAESGVGLGTGKGQMYSVATLEKLQG